MKISAKTFVIIWFVLAGLYGGYLLYRQLSSMLPEGLIQVAGVIDGDRVTVMSKAPGRVQKLMAQEGDVVTAGQVICTLDDSQVNAHVVQARQALDTLLARRQEAVAEVEVVKKEVPLAIDSAKAEVDKAKAMQTQAEAKAKQAAAHYASMKKAAQTAGVNPKLLDEANLAASQAKAELTAARTVVTQAQDALDHAGLGWERVQAAQESIKTLDAQIEEARTGLEKAQSLSVDPTVKAPVEGIIVGWAAGIGDFVAKDAPLVNILDLDHIYLKTSFRAEDSGYLRLGLPARIYLDLYPERFFNAAVGYLASGPELAPQEDQRPGEPQKYVYPAKLYLDSNPDHVLMPGHKAAAIVRWQETVSWTKPRPRK